ncbi:MAG: GatB/YqeY domain-containing protein, partial [bacterium]|nr:GatB/YqeY domain-containing protein [bacterium]
AQGKDEELSGEEMQDVVATEAKKRREAAEAFLKGGRPELAEKEKKELQVLLAYLPEQLTEEQIRHFVKEAIVKTEAQSPKDMGKIMGELAPKVKGKADGALVANIVKELLPS